MMRSFGRGLVLASLVAASMVASAQSKEPESTIRHLDGSKPAQPAATAKAAPVASAAVSAAPPVESPAMQSGQAALKKQDWPTALNSFKAELGSNPENRQAAFLAGNAALAMKDYSQAMSYYQPLLKSDPNDWRTRIQLVQAYGGAGMAGARDLERNKLRMMHLSHKDAEFSKTNAYVVETIDIDLGADLGVGLKTEVDAVEFFTPAGSAHVLYEFVVSGADGKPIERLNLEGVDGGGNSRQTYELAMYTGKAGAEKRGVFKKYATAPSYEAVRADVVTALMPAK